MYLLLIVMATATAAHAQNSYVVISPSKIRSNADLSLSVNILKSAGDVKIKASILRDTTVVTTGTGSFKAGVPSTLQLKVPASLPRSAYTLKVEGSGGLTFNKTATLTYNNKELSLFLQSDKAIYKPGDTVNFRAFGIYPDLKLYNGDMDISILDAEGNKIKQWQKEKHVDGVITKQLVLSSQPVLGDWRIRAKTANSNLEKTITIDKHVLPKFDVDVVMPPYALTTDTDITFTVKARYTYGKPVRGIASANIKVVSLYNMDDYDTAQSVSTVQVQVDGEARVSIPMSEVKKISSYLDRHLLIVTANVSESLTGNTMSGNGKVTLYDNSVSLEFPNSNPSTFKPGLQYTAYLKISQPDGLPVGTTTQRVKVNTNILIYLPEDGTITSRFYEMPTKTENLPEKLYDVPTNGLVAIPVDIPKEANSATIKAEFQSMSATLNLGKSHSPSDSYIQLLLETASTIEAGDLIKLRVKSTQPLTSLVYQILSRGGIVTAGSINANQQTDYAFSIFSDSRMAPNARIVVYMVRADGEIVTDSISFDISGAFNNKVSINVNATDSEPGDEVRVTVRADPSSIAYLLAIDQSVLLLKSGNDITTEDVYKELQAYDTINPVSRSGQDTFDCPDCSRRKRSIWWPFPIFYGGKDTAQIFEQAGVVVVTDALVYSYQEPFRHPFLFRNGLRGMGPLSGVILDCLPILDSRIVQDNNLIEPIRTRSVFPDIWIWTNMSVGANGTASISTKVPDTITSWVVSAFAVNSVTGLGVSPTQAKLQVFRPFFVSLNLPYSMTRGEQLALQATVFNYMQYNMQVRVTLAASNSFFNINVNGQEQHKKGEAVLDVFVRAGDANSVYFPIVPSDLGRIDVEVKAQSTIAADAVRRQLLVEAEGVPKEYNIPLLVDLTNGKTSFSDTVKLSLPTNVVRGSERVRVSAVGDLMGPAISGLDSLLKMPTGCGEQIMVYLAPDVSVTDYLKSVNQLSGDIMSKALSYMESGYQRELSYKHKDGSFSAFGERDNSGSMWLTAFVIRVLHQARSYIYIEESVLITALQWIIEKQNSNGSFPEPGIVIQKSMQGNTGSGTGLTVFVLMSLLENKDLLNATGIRGDQAVAKALAYVEREVAKTDDLYILTMASYVLQLASSSKTKSVLAKLEQKASKKDGLKYWHQVEPLKTTNPTWKSPNPTQAVDTEMTSYVLLTYTARREIAVAKDIVSWILNQQNPYGGFSSTQDTVVALYALSQFAKQTYSNNFNLQVITSLSPNQSYTFAIDQTNALLLQTQETKTVPSKVKISATGSGIALVQVAVFFNVETEIEDVKFELSVKLLEETINHLVLETCTRWLGEGPSSGMAVQEVGIPSGFEPDLESVTQLPILKNTETQNKKVIFYFDQISTTSVCLKIKVVRTGLVVKSQPSAVRMYDYYAPENQVTAFYQSQTLLKASFCDVCKECENCV